MTRFTMTVLLVIGIAAPLSALQAAAGPVLAALPYHVAASRMTLEQAAARVRKESGGKLLSADERRDVDGRAVYRIKVLKPGGIVKVIYIDPVSGARIRPQTLPD